MVSRVASVIFKDLLVERAIYDAHYSAINFNFGVLLDKSISLKRK